jgi:hypothetical protein
MHEAAMWLRLLWAYKGAAVHGHFLGQQVTIHSSTATYSSTTWDGTMNAS